MASFEVSDEEDNEEALCGASECTIQILENPVITWIGCETCDKWYHSACIGLGNVSKAELEVINYTCVQCSKP